MKSIKSAGGPLVCIERDIAPRWSGVQRSSLGPNARTDYDRACEIRDYVGTLKVGHGTALILGDIPMQTFTAELRGSLPQIVRVIYADPEADVLQMLEDTPDLDLADPIESIAFDVQNGSFMVFDSAFAGDHANSRALFFQIPPCRYEVVTRQLEPNDRTSVLVHQFVQRRN